MDMNVQKVISKMIAYFGQDVVRINHAIKVYGFAQSIAVQENITEEERFIIQLAAILHDIGIKVSERKYHSSAGKYQEIEGPPVAREILNEFGLNDSILDRICYLIGHHHSYNIVEGMDFQILVEADFIVNIFEDHMNTKQVNKIKEKYFKTSAGIQYLNDMYL